MKKYDIVVIGFGKAGKTFAKFSAGLGKKVALVEKSNKMYGGTCINVACIPTKVLVKAEREGLGYEEALARKFEVVEDLNNKNYHNLADEENIDVIDGVAKFISNKEIEVTDDEGQSHLIGGDIILINTGSTPNRPKIRGIDSPRVYDSASFLDLRERPDSLVIIGGGNISLEFASFMAGFGSKVTLLARSGVLNKEDKDIADEVIKDLEAKGIEIVRGAETQEIFDQDKTSIVRTNKGDYEADAVLVAVGRHPNTEGLGLENTDIDLGERGEILVDKNLETSVKNIYAAGDVIGGLQFTYKSLDDFRIIKSQVYGDKSYNEEKRGAIPYAVYITPVLARVGLTYEEAKDKGYDPVENKVQLNQIPRHKINNDPRGLFKVVVDKESKLILGASLYGENAEELINYIKMAIDNDIPYTYIENAIFTHPTMTESFNDLMKF
ncbi:MAG: FAD-dependent oxidoreductase [Anaerococcus sp.]|nr:FAD-dependent oxidoreductase [Peptoniphilaceae bacterium]MDY2919201.1 FAD-dependent oxidoreductase [Anaerococcus sp.]